MSLTGLQRSLDDSPLIGINKSPLAAYRDLGPRVRGTDPSSRRRHEYRYKDQKGERTGTDELIDNIRKMQVGVQVPKVDPFVSPLLPKTLTKWIAKLSP
jgi:hypothetical protein